MALHELDSEIGRDIVHPTSGVGFCAVYFEHTIVVAAMTDIAGGIAKPGALSALAVHVPLSDVSRDVPRGAQQGRMGDVICRKGSVIVGDAIEMIVAPGQEHRATGRAKRVDHEGVAKAHALAGDAVEVRRLEPGKPPALALFALHDAERVVALIVGVDEKKVGAIGRRGEAAQGSQQTKRRE